MKNYINLTNFNKEELDEFLTLIQDEKEALLFIFLMINMPKMLVKRKIH